MCAHYYSIEPSQELDILHSESIDPKQCRDKVVDEQSGPEGPGYPEYRAHDHVLGKGGWRVYSLPAHDVEHCRLEI